eukprot:1732186-Pleurochrysis_carterae.AAC.1
MDPCVTTTTACLNTAESASTSGPSSTSRVDECSSNPPGRTLTVTWNDPSPEKEISMRSVYLRAAVPTDGTLAGS